MVQLQKDLDQLVEGDRQLIVISQDSPEKHQAMAKKNKFTFPILSDLDQKAAAAFGILFNIDSDTAKRYKGFGLDLVAMYGRQQPVMAVPSVFLAGTDAKVKFQYVNPNYAERLAPDVLRSAVKSYLPTK